MVTLIPERLAALSALTIDPDSDQEKRRPGGQFTTAESFWSRVDRSGDCWLWTGRTDENGYGRVGYRRHKDEGAHRVSWALTHGGEIPTEWVLHRCDNPPCVQPEHLFLGDATDNNRDRQQKGRTRGAVTRSGAEHHRYTVTPEMALAMRDMRADGWTQQCIADQFNISRGYVAVVVAGVLARNAKGIRR